MQCSISVFYRYDPWQLKCIPNNSRMLFKLTNRWKQIRFFTDGGFLFRDKPFNIKFNGKTYTKQLTKTSYTEKLCDEITFFSFLLLVYTRARPMVDSRFEKWFSKPADFLPHWLEMYSVLLFGDFLLISSLTSILTCEGKLPVIFQSCHWR